MDIIDPSHAVQTLPKIGNQGQTRGMSAGTVYHCDNNPAFGLVRLASEVRSLIG
jgi:hypothetical protein